jgi:hypothetical protein
MHKTQQKPAFLVINAMDAPHRGRIIRLRLQGGPAPPLRALKGASLEARSPKGKKETLRVLGFFLGGGRPSDARFTRTGRIDLLVEKENGEGRSEVSSQWQVSGPQ